MITNLFLPFLIKNASISEQKFKHLFYKVFNVPFQTKISFYGKHFKEFGRYFSLKSLPQKLILNISSVDVNL